MAWRPSSSWGRLARNGRLGALAERDFRLLFLGTTITTVGDGLAGIALAFAVLDRGSATALGIVFAVRMAVMSAVVLFGGVIADRLPRNLVLTGASLVQATAQALTAAFVLTGAGGLWPIVVLQGLYGVGAGVVIPAEVGLVPQTVSPARLQQANALQGLSRNVVRVLGPALGGALVVAGSPGVALAVDAGSFLVCAALLARIRLAPLERGARESMLHDLRVGWRAFTSRTWLWASVVLFGLGNFVWASWIVLGPVVAKQDLGGAGPWAVVLAAGGVGSILGSVLAIRLRPRRPLVAVVLAAVPLSFQLVALALVTPVWVLAATSFVAGAGIAVHLTLWFTLFQREIPEEMQSRVSAYDTLGSFVLMPAGMALAGPVADAVGVAPTLWGAAVVMWVSWAGILGGRGGGARRPPHLSGCPRALDYDPRPMSVRVRMAPSPTGMLHIGGVRTFLFNWLFARGRGGECLLRIENTDTSREVAEATDQIQRSLSWVGIDWDGPVTFQLEAMDRCRELARRLVADGHAYEDEGAIRFRMPDDGVTAWDDAVKGRVEVPNEQLDDLVIVRSDGRATYNFASPVEDMDDRITHVIRGDDHVSNTPKQIRVLEALGHAPPVYAHVPSIFGEDGRKLSKRHGAVSVDEFRAAGYVPAALMNFLALLGWAPDGETTLMDRDELVARFSLERVGQSPATFDYAKLDWMNGVYLRAMSHDAYAGALVTYLGEQGYDWDAQRVWQAAPLVQEKIGRLGEFPAFAGFLFHDVDPDPSMLDRRILDEAASALAGVEPWSAASIEAALKGLCERLGEKPRVVYGPIRVAVTGSRISPGLYESLELLGRDASLARIRAGAGRAA